MNQDYARHEGYEVDLGNNNDENNLYHTIVFTDPNNKSLLSGYIYIKINEAK